MGLIQQGAAGYALGRTVITDLHTEGFGLGFSALRLSPGQRLDLETERETAWLMMQGDLRIEAPGLSADFSRGSLFDDLPQALHVAAGTQVGLHAQSEVELLCFEVDNPQTFSPRIIDRGAVRNEARGKGALRDGAFRYVRTLIDDQDGPPQAQLVLGEVVNLPGRWSSYPPHHHEQPEIYHYRFTDPRGYGHAEEGEQVFKVREGDTLLIHPGLDHSQCAAPGYGMWYAWAIRHLDRQRYSVPEFTEPHRWTLAEGARTWWPRGED